MLQILKRLTRMDRDIYKKWKEATKPVRIGRPPFDIVYFPFESVEIDKNGYVCNEKGASACTLYCCSNRLSMFINPLEGLFLSSVVARPLSSILDVSSPLIYVLDSKRALVSTVFELKKENGYCVFSDRPNSNRCKEYPRRSLQCRMYPFAYVEYIGLVQRKSCPGFKKGKVVTPDAMQYFTEMGRMVSFLNDVLFEVDQDDFIGERYDKIGNRIWDRMGVDIDKAIGTITKESLHQYVEKEKEISKFGEELEIREIDQNRFEGFMLSCYSTKSGDKPLEIAVHSTS